MIVWVDATAGASGDMLLGALVDAGVDLDVLRAAVEAVVPGEVTLTPRRVHRSGMVATQVEVTTVETDTARPWPVVHDLLTGADLDERVRHDALAVFEALARAEAVVHGIDTDDVHFHEVGALDSVADVVGVCAGFAALGADRLLVSTIGVGSGRTGTAHGDLPIPVPAVVELLRGRPTTAGPGSGEACTPTGAALLAVLAESENVQPTMEVVRVGVGAGTRDPQSHPNVVRLLVGEPVSVGQPQPLLLETNVDDMDPRLWPDVIARLLEAGASDAWLTPILMKKGRPAQTLSVLVAVQHADAVRREIFRSTTTIGLRETTVGKRALDRATVEVDVLGRVIRVKVASLDGVTFNAQPEFEDVRAAAESTGLAAKEILARAVAAYRAEQT